jgi:hypothetical protein
MVTVMDLDGLPMSSFSPQDEREELMAIFAATVYERGFALTWLEDVARRASVPLERFERLWPTPVDCLLDTTAAHTRQLFVRVAAAFMEAGGDGPVALHRALSAMLYDLSETPELTYLSVIELPRLGPLVYERHDRMLDLFSELLVSGFSALDEPPPSREIVSLCIGGGVWESIYRHAAQRTLHALPDALPAISYVCVSTFFGVDEALRVSTLPRVQARSGRETESTPRMCGFTGPTPRVAAPRRDPETPGRR